MLGTFGKSIGFQEILETGYSVLNSCLVAVFDEWRWKNSFLENQLYRKVLLGAKLRLGRGCDIAV